ncbi:hypothetical protein ADK67_31835 [Saccharothrix sp. NRRL B-16348]|uniref:CHAT domain-containing protein n=1 Tax=Saccharothrix sp. NRRL B-16348 TaxID=1415542 RepID=UPI0006AED910|nr:CHAT domain-containing protein [Saccharothrix sp. NRRL B-16348]KOX20110.1 hypothetical protein ADK67_31835 [Saccharothrix sp. NRRL B-16348]
MYSDVVTATVLLERYRATADQHALHEARRLLEAVIAHPTATPDLLVQAQGTLARVLRDLAALSSQPVPLLDQAVAAAEAAARSPAAEPRRVPELLNNLALNLTDRYERTGRLSDLARAEATYRAALDGAVTADERCVISGGWSTVLALRHHATRDAAPLIEAIRLCREATAFTALPSHIAMAHHQLGNHLLTWWEHSEDTTALREAVQHAEKAAAADSSTEHRVLYLHALGTARGKLAESTGDVELADSAAEVLEEALRICGASGLRPTSCLNALANVRDTQHTLTGDHRRLDEAVELARQAVAGIGPGDIDYGGVIVNLANRMLRRWRVTGVPGLLIGTRRMLEEALVRLPESDTFQPAARAMLGTVLIEIAETTTASAEAGERLAEAQSYLEAALADVPTSSSYRAVMVNNLASVLRRRHRRGVDPDALARADVLQREELARLSADGPARRLLAANWAVTRLAMVDAGHPVTVLAEPEALVRTLLAAGADGYATAALTANLIEILLRTDHSDPVVAPLVDRVLTSSATPQRDRVRLLAGLGRRAAEGGDWRRAWERYSAAVDELVELSPRTWRRDDRERDLRDFHALASDAAACALHDGRVDLAVEVLERGRGSLVQHVHLERVALDRLRAAHPDLVGEYESVDRALARLPPDPHAPESFTRDEALAALDDLDHRRTLETRRRDVLARIRAVDPGFLRPSFHALLAAVGSEPVVVLNVSRFGSDAVLLGGGRARVLPLPRLTSAAVTNQVAPFLGSVAIGLDARTYPLDVRMSATETVRGVLSWLWLACVEPVLTALGYDRAGADVAEGRHVRWCPTGFLGFLPVHAAGHYPWGATAPTDSTLDRVVSSYTPTLRALAESRSRPRTTATKRSVLAVGLARTPGLADLPNVPNELRSVVETVGAGTELLDEDATAERLLAELPRHPWLHFAGHAGQNPALGEDAVLYTHDHQATGPVTGTRIGAVRLPDAEFAFLSACESAAGRIDLADEPVHAAGSLQQAGFAQVVATRWTTKDAVAAKVVRAFYREFTGRPEAAATALHRSVRRIRDECAGSPFPAVRAIGVLHWAPFIHIG